MAMYTDPMGELKGMIEKRFAQERQQTEERLSRGFEHLHARLEEAIEERAGISDRDVRMSVLHLAQHMVPAKEMVDYADSLAQYVLTGKKPGTLDSLGDPLGLLSDIARRVDRALPGDVICVGDVPAFTVFQYDMTKVLVPIGKKPGGEG